MKKLKILLAVLLVLAMVFALTACDDGEQKNPTPTPDGTHNHVWGDYISDGEQGHHQECTDPDCDNITGTVSHTFNYTSLGMSQHKAVCTAKGCGYTIKAEPCTFENGACKYCGTKEAEDVGSDGIVTVYFHVPDAWSQENLHVYSYYGEGNELLGAWPGTGTLTDEDGDGWYECKIANVPTGHVANDLYVIPNDNVADGTDENGNTVYKGNKTGDVAVASATCWIPSTAGTKSFATKEEAVKAEAGAPGPDAWIIVGTHNGWGETVEDNDYVFLADADYTVTMEFAANDEFKIKKNSSGWEGEIGYSALGEVTADESLELTGNLKSLFKEGGDYGGNIVVTNACRLQITLDPTAKKINIKILFAPGFVPGEGGDDGGGGNVGSGDLIMAGVINGETDWSNQSTKHPLTKNDDGTYTITVTFKQNDNFKIWHFGSYDNAIWEGGKTVTITYAEGVDQVNNLFGNNGGNVSVNYDCTVTITVSASNQVSVHVTALSKEQAAVIYYLAGDLTGAAWGANNSYKFTDNGDGTYTLKNASLGAGKKFKVFGSNNTWYGYDDIKITGDIPASNFSKDTSDTNGNILVGSACFVEITWNPTTKTLTLKNLAGGGTN